MCRKRVEGQLKESEEKMGRKKEEVGLPVLGVCHALLCFVVPMVDAHSTHRSLHCSKSFKRCRGPEDPEPGAASRRKWRGMVIGYPVHVYHAKIEHAL